MLRQRITNRMNILQGWMEDNYHLRRPQVVEEHIQTIRKFWNILNEEDRDYIDGCRNAIESKTN